MKTINEYIHFLIEEKGEQIIHQGIPKKAFIREISVGSHYYQDKVVYTDFPIQTGEYILYQGLKWMITNQVNQDVQSYKARMRTTHYDIKMVVDGELHTFATIIEAISFGVTSNSFMTMLDGKIQVTLPATGASEGIAENQRFIIMGRAWKVIGVDRSNQGLLILHADKDAFNVNTDDVENGIANADQIATWDIVVEGFNRQVLLGAETTLVGKVLKNGVVVTNQKLCWQTGDETILTVKDGTMMPHKLGVTTLTARIEGNESVHKEFEVEVVSQLESIVTYKMWCIFPGEDMKYYDYFDVYENYSGQYGAEKYINGTLAEVNDTYTFVLEAGGIPSEKYVFTVLSDEMCEIRCNRYWYGEKLKLKAISNETNEQVEVLIELCRL